MAYGLDRFVLAQEHLYAGVLEELRRGRKTGHWIWFIFPQVAGLGSSGMSQRFAISSLAEARAYLAHPVLGARMRECAAIVLATTGRTAEEIFGSLDAMKVRSSMTLFHCAAPDEPLFVQLLDRFYAGVADARTDGCSPSNPCDARRGIKRTRTLEPPTHELRSAETYAPTAMTWERGVRTTTHETGEVATISGACTHAHEWRLRHARAG